ncbi:hypothetical protein ACHAXT_007594 [Thalassiosira profunda]
MLRHCVQGAGRHRLRGPGSRGWSSLASSLDEDGERRRPAGPSARCTHHLHRRQRPECVASSGTLQLKRRFGISRKLDPLAQHGTINKLEDDDDDVEAAGDAGGPFTADDLDLMGTEVEGALPENFWDDDGGGDSGGRGEFSDIFGAGGDEDNGEKDEKDLTPEERADRAYRQRQADITAELDTRTGRLWTDEWIIADEEWMSPETYDDIEEWNPNCATRKSLESVKVFAGGVPTLKEMGALALPRALPPHPGHGNPTPHARHRKRQLRRKLRTSVQLAVADDLRRILKMNSWEQKQEAVDGLFEAIEERVREREPVLGKLPEFPELCEKGLEDVLQMVHQKARGAGKKKTVDSTESEGGGEAETDGGGGSGDVVDVMDVQKKEPVPVFMDLLAAAQTPQPSSGDEDADETAKPSLSEFFQESNDAGVPNLLHPLNVHHRDGVGRMVEEWQLAANKETKRIMMRECMREIAAEISGKAHCCEAGVAEAEKGAARVFVSGTRGVGKTAALAGIVASARISGHIVLYLPDGDRLRKHGFYVTPCDHRKGLYNLPEIAKEFCQQLLTSHLDDINAMAPVSREEMKEYLSDDQITRVFKRAYREDDAVSDEEAAAMDALPLEKLLRVGTGSAQLSSGCYGAAIGALMTQTVKPFTVVMDEYNVYYDHGHYFHMDYEPDVRKAIPPNRITVFKPFMDAMGLYPTEAGTEMNDELAKPSKEAMMKWGSIVAATSECRAVRRTFTQSLMEAARALSDDEDHPVKIVDVRRFSDVEVQHVLYNYEVTGVGRLRFDRGNTALEPEEVEYLRLVSGGSGQQLMDAVMLP